MALVLASQSPRRRELMAFITPDFVVDEAGINEDAFEQRPSSSLALSLARAKAEAVAGRRPQDVVIGCDTVVEAADQTLGKPKTAEEAAGMLRLLSGRRHYVYTGVGIFVPGQPEAAAGFVETTAVDFAPVPEADIAAYCKTDEPYDKAGGYAIQGWAARYIRRIEGCFYNVMGLPVAALYRELRRLDLV